MRVVDSTLFKPCYCVNHVTHSSSIFSCTHSVIQRIVSVRYDSLFAMRTLLLCPSSVSKSMPSPGFHSSLYFLSKLFAFDVWVRKMQHNLCVNAPDDTVQCTACGDEVQKGGVWSRKGVVWEKEPFSLIFDAMAVISHKMTQMPFFCDWHLFAVFSKVERIEWLTASL